MYVTSSRRKLMIKKCGYNNNKLFTSAKNAVTPFLPISKVILPSQSIPRGLSCAIVGISKNAVAQWAESNVTSYVVCFLTLKLEGKIVQEEKAHLIMKKIGCRIVPSSPIVLFRRSGSCGQAL